MSAWGVSQSQHGSTNEQQQQQPERWSRWSNTVKEQSTAAPAAMEGVSQFRQGKEAVLKYYCNL
jgi:hypothetical protein